MITYYVEKDDKIILYGTEELSVKHRLMFMPPYRDLEIKQTERPIENNEWADTPEYIAKKHKQEVTIQVNTLENNTGLKRALREIVLLDTVQVSEYLKSKAQEIEDLAQELRGE